jgi:putative heme iron utilization protein
MKTHEILDKPTGTVETIAKKHNVSADQIRRQLSKGIRVELEHTSSPDIAQEIALDHLGEFPDYYTRLAKAEK